MSDINELLNNPTIKTIKKVAELSSTFVTAATTSVAVTEFLIKFFDLTSSAPDPVMESLKQVHAHLSRIEDAVIDADIADRERHLDVLAAQASTAARTAAEFFRSGAASTDPLWHGRLSDALRDTDVALSTLINNVESGSFWTRPENPSAISQEFDPRIWMNLIADRAELVAPRRAWDYRWGLPAMMHAIMCHLLVLRAFNPDASRVRGDYRRIGRAVNQVFRKMDGGVRALVLTEEHIRRIPTHGVPVAVVDIHGGVAAAGVSGNATLLALNGQNPGMPFPHELLLSGPNSVEVFVHNAKTLSLFWENHIRVRIGLSELLMVAGQFENLLTAPLPAPEPAPQGTFSQLLYVCEREPRDDNAPGHVPGAIFGVDRDALLRRYRYLDSGEADVSGATGWSESSSNPVGSGWAGFKHLLGGDMGVILGVDREDFLRWYRYTGNGESDPAGALHWHQNSGHRIGRGWGGFVHLCATAGPTAGSLTVYAVDPAGDLRWYGYTGSGEADETGAAGWLANSGNRIGHDWANFHRLVAAGRTLYGVGPDGLLRWFRYEGDGRDDTSWHANSGNPIGNGWQGFRALFGGVREDGADVLFGVAQNGDLLWYSYAGDGSADASGATGWHANSGNPIGNGW